MTFCTSYSAMNYRFDCKLMYYKVGYVSYDNKMAKKTRFMWFSPMIDLQRVYNYLLMTIIKTRFTTIFRVPWPFEWGITWPIIKTTFMIIISKPTQFLKIGIFGWFMKISYVWNRVSPTGINKPCTTELRLDMNNARNEVRLFILIYFIADGRFCSNYHVE